MHAPWGELLMSVLRAAAGCWGCINDLTNGRKGTDRPPNRSRGIDREENLTVKARTDSTKEKGAATSYR